nr:hypothetical protein CFP56_09064 [Quercus suber]
MPIALSARRRHDEIALICFFEIVSSNLHIFLPISSRPPRWTCVGWRLECMSYACNGRIVAYKLLRLYIWATLQALPHPAITSRLSRCYHPNVPHLDSPWKMVCCGQSPIPRAQHKPM